MTTHRRVGRRTVALLLSAVLASGAALVSAVPAQAAAAPVVPPTTSPRVSTPPRATPLPYTVSGAYGIAMSANSSEVFAVAGKTLNVVSTSTRALVKSIALPVSFRAAELSSDGREVFAYDTTTNALAKPQAVTEIDTSSLRIIRTITLPSSLPMGRVGLTSSPDGSTLLLSGLTTSGTPSLKVAAIDAATGAIRWVASAAGGVSSADVAFTPDSTRVLVSVSSGVGRGSLLELDSMSGSTLRSDALSISPRGVVVSQDGSEAFVVGSGTAGGTTPGSFAQVVDLATGSTTHSLALYIAATRAYLSGDGTRILLIGTAREANILDVSGLWITELPLSGPTADASTVTRDGDTSFLIATTNGLERVGTNPPIEWQHYDAAEDTTGAVETSDDASAFARNATTGALSYIDLRLGDWTPLTSRVSASDRYGTAVAASRSLFPKTAPVVYLINGTDWADSLSAGPAA